jgi:hypothetical protein
MKPVGVAAALGLGVYVFVMPQLSTFLELGLLIFFCMFITCFFFSGLGRLAGIVGILNQISIQNQQSYNFAAMANGYIFMLMIFAFIFAMSYMLRSSRPEKAVLHLVGRFFRSAEFLISRVAQDPGRAPGPIGRWRIAFYRHELATLPDKIGAWGKAIDHKLFPNNTPEQVNALLASLQTIVYRTEALLDVGDGPQAVFIAWEIGGDIRAWHAAIETTFNKWARNPEVDPVADLREPLAAMLARLEERIDEALDASDGEAFSEADGENFYRLLGGFRGVSEAAVAYAEVAGTIDWAQWREEVFS